MRPYLLYFLLGLACPLTLDGQEGKCSLCPTDEGIANPSSIIPQLEIPGDPNPNCQDALDYALTVDADDEICPWLQAQAAFCGCAGVDPPAPPCSLCANGESPPQSELKTGARDTCEELSAYLSFLSVEDCQSERGQILLRNAFGCGCQDATTECAMCPDGTIQMSKPDNVIPFLALVDGVGNPTCLDVAVMASSAAAGTVDCDLVQEQAGFCGCANVQPLNECSFCPGGEDPSNMDLVVATSDTCRELNEYMTYMDAEACATGRASNIQALGFVCGCPNTQPQCSLCPNGESPPFPDKLPGNGDFTCGRIAQDAAGLTGAICDDQRDTILAIAAARCECEDADYPACSFQQNPNLCTEELLASIPDVDCECYAFCDFEFVQCHEYPGGLLLGEQCLGTPVAGCNRATAQRNKEKQENKNEPEEIENASSSIVRRTLLGAILPIWLTLSS